jgi:hypothetical protein
MRPEFEEEILEAQYCPVLRPSVQANTRAIAESIPPVSKRQTQGGLAYPYPGKGVSGETTN